MELSFTSNDRGQVGIGTLIVFIAMVLVAAIAAGVLINTAGFLQTQAEDTGTESTEQVATNLNVITTVGEVSNSGTTISELQIGVQPAAGSDDLNLEELSVQYVSDDSFANLVHIQQADTDGALTVFNTEPITAEDGTDNVMTDNADRYELVVPLNTERPFTKEASLDVDNSGSEQVYKVDVAFDAADSDLTDVASAFPNLDASDFTDVNATQDNYDNAVLFDGSDDTVAISGTTDLQESSTKLDGNIGADTEVRRAVAIVDEVEQTELEGYAEPVTTADDSTGTDTDYDGLEQPFYDGVSNNGGDVTELDEGEVAELTFTTETGAQTQAILQVPDSLAGEDDGDTVDL